MNLWIPHNYQLTATSFQICNPYSGLFLDPGLGKTSITLAVIKILLGCGVLRGALVVAPLRVTYSVWPREIEKWANFNNLTYHVLHENDGQAALWTTKADIFIINPEGLPWLLEALLSMYKQRKQIPFDGLWIDESTKFKNHKAKTRFDTIVTMLPIFKHRHIMTGTPAPKSLLDLWSQIYILDEGKTLKTSFYHYRNKYFESHDWDAYSYHIKDGAADLIHKAIAPLVLEMAAKDYLDIPELVYNDIYIDLPEKAMKHYKRMEREFFIELDNKSATAKTTASKSMKCHQIANGKVYEDTPETEEEMFLYTREAIPVHKAKVEALVDLIDELNGKPLFIAYWYNHDLDALRNALGADLPYIGKGVNQKQAARLEDDWNAGVLPVLAGHPASVAHGLNLQESGNDICWFSLTWNLEEYIQFIARIWRQGVSGNQVRVHHLIARHTVDEAMLSRLGEKAEQQQDLRDAIRMYRKQLRNSN